MLPSHLLLLLPVRGSCVPASSDEHACAAGHRKVLLLGLTWREYIHRASPFEGRRMVMLVLLTLILLQISRRGSIGNFDAKEYGCPVK